MKLLHKVVKSSKINLTSDTVGIENTVILPQKTEESGESADILEEVIDHEGIARERANEILKAADEELNKARARAQQIIASANEQAKKIEEDAFNDAFDKGYRQGQSESRTKCESYIKAAAGLIAEINSKKDALFKRYENEILETALNIAEKITLKIADNEKDALVSMIKSAAKHFRNSDYIKLTLSDVDVAVEIVSDQEFLSEILGGIPYIETELIGGGDGGTLILDNGSEIIDASVSAQLNMIREIASK
ncbi:MAG: hypothetical protein GX967_04130 [Clostridiales bacterium]|nr:hypothetical protein [Clostridiales bacterium]